MWGPSLENLAVSPTSMVPSGNGQVGVRFPSFLMWKGSSADIISLWVCEPGTNFLDWKNCSTQVYGLFSTARGAGAKLERREGC